MSELLPERVRDVLGHHVPLYRRRSPDYQITLLQSLYAMWPPTKCRLLDVGGGTGVIAQAVADLFPRVERIASVDLYDRFLPTLTIETGVYDGRSLPFDDGAFDTVMLVNVLHHVPAAARAALLLECARVSGGGSILIKDHLCQGRVDALRLAVLDVVGNTPFHGMVKASYLHARDWNALARAAGYRIDTAASGRYRSGVFERAFPNRLEITMRWEKRRPA